MNPTNQATESALSPPPAISPSEGASSWASLASTARKILEEKDIIQVLRTVCEEACQVLGADRSLIVRIQMDDPPRRQVMSSHNVQQEFIDALHASRAKSFIEGIIENIANSLIIPCSVFRTNPMKPFNHRRISGFRLISALYWSSDLGGVNSYLFQS